MASLLVAELRHVVAQMYVLQADARARLRHLEEMETAVEEVVA